MRFKRVAVVVAVVEGASSFNGDVSQWDMSQVTDMEVMCKLSCALLL